MRIALSVFALGLMLQACANKPCRELRNPELAASTSSGATTAATPAQGGKVSDNVSGQSRIFVAKADGSLQCGQGKPIELAAMENELKGIQVFSRKKENDGKMRIQLCGSPTGMMNIYEIPASSLAEAEKRGFKKF